MAKFEKEKNRLENVLEVGEFVPLKDQFNSITKCVVMEGRTMFRSEKRYLGICKFNNKLTKFILIPTEDTEKYESTSKGRGVFAGAGREIFEDFSVDGIDDLIGLLTDDGEGELFVLEPKDSSEYSLFSERNILFNK